MELLGAISHPVQRRQHQQYCNNADQGYCLSLCQSTTSDSCPRRSKCPNEERPDGLDQHTEGSEMAFARFAFLALLVCVASAQRAGPTVVGPNPVDQFSGVCNGCFFPERTCCEDCIPKACLNCCYFKLAFGKDFCRLPCCPPVLQQGQEPCRDCGFRG
ncbi:hypothetical protein BSKO_11318 [Bryopsis sp. KO-2023]|nr:hypothetical protein BSKO_11318 [Bryopsis sp. KO-2023]